MLIQLGVSAPTQAPPSAPPAWAPWAASSPMREPSTGCSTTPPRRSVAFGCRETLQPHLLDALSSVNSNELTFASTRVRALAEVSGVPSEKSHYFVDVTSTFDGCIWPVSLGLRLLRRQEGGADVDVCGQRGDRPAAVPAFHPSPEHSKVCSTVVHLASLGTVVVIPRTADVAVRVGPTRPPNVSLRSMGTPS